MARFGFIRLIRILQSAAASEKKREAAGGKKAKAAPGRRDETARGKTATAPRRPPTAAIQRFADPPETLGDGIQSAAHRAWSFVVDASRLQP
jgi:hypothetical protein